MIAFASLEMVGRYALNFSFSDGHSTGIFSFEMLWKLCNAQEDARRIKDGPGAGGSGSPTEPESK